MTEAVREIALKEGVTAKLDGKTISFSKAGKSISRDLGKERVSIEVKDSKVVLRTPKDGRRENMLLNVLQSHVENMMKGLEKPFVYHLSVVFSHFPMTVAVKGNWVEVNNFTGEKKPRKARILPDTQVEIKGKDIVVKSHNKEFAGQTAANLENATRVRGKDTRVYQDGIYIVNKE